MNSMDSSKKAGTESSRPTSRRVLLAQTGAAAVVIGLGWRAGIFDGEEQSIQHRAGLNSSRAQQESLAAAIRNARGAPVTIDRNLDLSGWTRFIVPPEGVHLILRGGVTIRGNPGQPWLYVAGSSGNVRVFGSPQSKVADFQSIVSFDNSAAIDLLQIEGLNIAASGPKTKPSLVRYYAVAATPTRTASVRRIAIADCSSSGSRSCIYFRGYWDEATIEGNRVAGFENYAIRLGGDVAPAQWFRQGRASIRGNIIADGYNPQRRTSNECNGIAVFGARADILDNQVSTIGGADQDDKEGIYTKVGTGEIARNRLTNACIKEGSIALKSPAITAAVAAGLGPLVVRDNICISNDGRARESGISIQRSRVRVAGNQVSGFAGLDGSAGIVVKYRSSYSDITIEDNEAVNCAIGILVWPYGRSILVRGNRIRDFRTSGIQVRTEGGKTFRRPKGESILEGLDLVDNDFSTRTSAPPIRLNLARGDTPRRLRVTGNSANGRRFSVGLSGACEGCTRD